jgi:TolB-like protein/Tfp pilus assembly protein PilF
VSASRPPGWQAFFAELKRRRVFRVITVYGIVGFAVLQGADLLVPALLLPEWTYRFLALLLLAGFPIAILLAWAFDVTPEGVRRTEPAHADELAGIVALPRRQRWGAGLLALAAGLVLLAGSWLTLRDWQDAKPAGTVAAGPSIAVLPFSNLARTEATEPFVDGVHDDLLTQLSKIGALRVISRTSVQEYRNTRKNVREIASELGVSHVLEGGVQRAGEAVRINVQLIDARTDEHVWAETYNRTLTVANIFAIQTEIAEAIATAMRAQLTPAERADLAAARPTESLAAYDQYQRGAAYFRRTLVPADVQNAVAAFDEAVRIDPGFAEAWAWLSIARSTLSWEFGHVGELAGAAAAASRAETLAPNGLLAKLARGYYHYYGERNYDAALTVLRQAEILAPANPEVLKVTGWVLRRMGRWEEALDYFRRAFERDPRDAESTWASIAVTAGMMGRFEESERYSELAVSLDPGYGAPYMHLALLALLESGDTARAAGIVERAGSRVDPARVVFSWPELSRALAYRLGARLASTTSDIADDHVGRAVTWRPQALTPTAYFMQKGRMLRVLGDVPAARAHFDSARVLLEAQVSELPPDAIWGYQGSLHSALGVAYAGLGRSADAIRFGELGLAAVLRVGDALTAPSRRSDLAEIHIMTGNPAKALEQLAQLVTEPGPYTAALVRVDPLWAPLRADPRFQRLTRQ